MKILKDWSLIIAMLCGVLGYFGYAHAAWLRPTHAFVGQAVSVLQPALIFGMLFFSFCKVDLRRVRLCPWHLWLLLIQGGLFVGIGLLLVAMPHSHMRIVLEGAMICLICPTATASPVITKKLGGDLTHITTYIILINVMAAILIPAMLPYVHPHQGMSTVTAMMLILGKVFPLLLMPLVGAILIRLLWPKLHRRLARMQQVSFYLWLVALALALAVTTRSIVHTTIPFSAQAWLVAVSLICCLGQFWTGRRIGAHYDDTITAGQALGQKNTVFAIWLGYTFFTPITSIVGGFYSIWHNLVNSYQLYKANHSDNDEQILQPTDNRGISLGDGRMSKR